MSLEPLSSELSAGLVDRVTSATDDIQNTISYVREYADEMRQTLENAIEDMADVVGDYDFNIKDVDTTIPGIAAPNIPELPTFGDLPINWDFPDPITPPVLQPYGEIDFEFVTPAPPQEIDGNFSWERSSYSSEMWEALFSKVHGVIVNGGTGIPDDVFSAMVDTEKETRRLNQDREYKRAVKAISGTGFNLPSGRATALIKSLVAENIAKDQDALNSITIKSFDVANENNKFFVTAGSTIEGMIRATFESTESMGLEAEKATKEFLIKVYSENVRLYLAKWEGVKMELQSKIEKVNAITSMNEGLNKTFIAQTEGFRATIGAIVEKNKGLVDTRKGEVDVYVAKVDAVSKQYMMVVEEMKANIKKIETEANLVIEEEKLKMIAYTTKAELSDGINQAVANIGAQAVASALGAIHTTMSESYSAGDSISHRGETIYNML